MKCTLVQKELADAVLNIQRAVSAKSTTPALEGILLDASSGKLTLSEESRPFQGGLYVQNGNVEVNCTFAALIRLEKEQTAKDVAGILFD